MTDKTPAAIMLSALLLAAACSGAPERRQAAETAANDCSVRMLLRLREPTDSSPKTGVLQLIAGRTQVRFESVTQLDDRSYRILLRSAGDCVSALRRLNADSRVEYATPDESKRIH